MSAFLSAGLGLIVGLLVSGGSGIAIAIAIGMALGAGAGTAVGAAIDSRTVQEY